MIINQYAGLSWSNSKDSNEETIINAPFPNTSGKVWRINSIDVLFNHDQNIVDGVAIYSSMTVRDFNSEMDLTTVNAINGGLLVAQGSQLTAAGGVITTEVNPHPFPVALSDAPYVMDGLQLAVLARNMGTSNRYDATVVYQVSIDMEEVSLSSKIQGEILARK